MSSCGDRSEAPGRLRQTRELCWVGHNARIREAERLRVRTGAQANAEDLDP